MAENPVAQILSAVGQEDRIQILKQLSRKSPQSFTLLMKALEFDPKEDAGRFNYHLRELEKTGLIQKTKDSPQAGYQLTATGVKIVQVLDTLEQVSRERGEKIFVRTSRAKIEDFNRDKIKQSLVTEAGAPERLADQIAKEAEERLVRLKILNLTAPMIREFVNAILLEKGLVEIQHELTRAGLPIHDVHEIITKTDRYIDMAYSRFRSPELIQWLAAKGVLSQYNLVKVIPQTITDKHLRGDIHLGNVAGWALRPASIQHDIRVILSNGLAIPGHTWRLNPPRNLFSALYQISKFLELGQTHFGGYQNIPFFNTLLAPFAYHSTGKETRKAIEFFIDELRYSFAGRGGQPISVSLQCDLQIPEFLQDLQIASPVGSKKALYRDYFEEGNKILATLLDVLKGRRQGDNPVTDPVIILTVSKAQLEDPHIQPILEDVYKIIAETGNILLLHQETDKPNLVTYSGDLFRLDSEWQHDPELDTMRTGCLDTVVLNLPRLALNVKQDDDRFFDELAQLFDLSVLALKNKHRLMKTRIVKDKNLPFLDYPVNNEPYFRLENATHTISFVGLPEAVQIHTGANINDDSSGKKFALSIINDLHNRLQKTQVDTNMRWVLGPIANKEAATRFFDLDKVNSSTSIEDYSVSNLPSSFTGSLDEYIRLEEEFAYYENAGRLLEIIVNSPARVPAIKKIVSKVINQSNIELFALTQSLAYCSHCNKIIYGKTRNNRSYYPKKCETCGSSGKNIRYLHREGGRLLLKPKLKKYFLQPVLKK